VPTPMAIGIHRHPPTVDVNLSTAEFVQSLLEKVGVPVSRNWLLERLHRSGHATTRPRLNRVLDHYFRLGLAIEGSKGVQWTHNMSPQLLYAVAVGKRL
jgi:hypothetical protein